MSDNSYLLAQPRARACPGEQAIPRASESEAACAKVHPNEREGAALRAGGGVEVKRKRSLRAIKRDLDTAFSRFIRKRDADEEGMGVCISCGQWRYLQCGHFVKRQFTATRFREDNSHGQCAACNCSDADIEYTIAMQKKYGQAVVDELLQAKRQTVKLTRSDYETLLAKYSGD